MKVCFVGMGSIGKRHFRNLYKVATRCNLNVEIHAFRETDHKLEEEFASCIQKEFYRIEEADNDYDIVFICNPTNKHYSTIKAFVGITSHMFIEKPLFDDHNLDMTTIGFRKEGIYYVAAPLKFCPVLEYLKSEIDAKSVFSARAVCSSYLPDWRAGIDYRNIYSANKDQGGGVELDLIHEWDYIRYLFGDPKRVYHISGKFSGLEIDSNDLAVYIAEYDSMVTEIHLDYFGRQAERTLTLYTESETIKCNLINQTVLFMKENRLVSFEKQDMYEIEMAYFINLIQYGGINVNTPEHAMESMKIAFGEVIR